MADGTIPATTARLFPTHPAVLPRIRSFLLQQAADAHLGEQASEDLLVAVCEACTNALRHTLSPHIRLTWRQRPAQVEVDVEDEGVFERRAVVVDAQGAGVGIPLMVALTDEFTIRGGTEQRPGTLVRLVKYLRPA